MKKRSDGAGDSRRFHRPAADSLDRKWHPISGVDGRRPAVLFLEGPVASKPVTQVSHQAQVNLLDTPSIIVELHQCSAFVGRRVVNH